MKAQAYTTRALAWVAPAMAAGEELRSGQFGDELPILILGERPESFSADRSERRNHEVHLASRFIVREFADDNGVVAAHHHCFSSPPTALKAFLASSSRFGASLMFRTP